MHSNCLFLLKIKYHVDFVVSAINRKTRPGKSRGNINISHMYVSWKNGDVLVHSVEKNMGGGFGDAASKLHIKHIQKH